MYSTRELDLPVVDASPARPIIIPQTSADLPVPFGPITKFK